MLADYQFHKCELCKHTFRGELEAEPHFYKGGCVDQLLHGDSINGGSGNASSSASSPLAASFAALREHHVLILRVRKLGATANAAASSSSSSSSSSSASSSDDDSSSSGDDPAERTRKSSASLLRDDDDDNDDGLRNSPPPFTLLQQQSHFIVADIHCTAAELSALILRLFHPDVAAFDAAALDPLDHDDKPSMLRRVAFRKTATRVGHDLCRAPFPPPQYVVAAATAHVPAASAAAASAVGADSWSQQSFEHSNGTAAAALSMSQQAQRAGASSAAAAAAAAAARARRMPGSLFELHMSTHGARIVHAIEYFGRVEEYVEVEVFDLLNFTTMFAPSAPHSGAASAASLRGVSKSRSSAAAFTGAAPMARLLAAPVWLSADGERLHLAGEGSALVIPRVAHVRSRRVHPNVRQDQRLVQRSGTGTGAANRRRQRSDAQDDGNNGDRAEDDEAKKARVIGAIVEHQPLLHEQARTFNVSRADDDDAGFYLPAGRAVAGGDDEDEIAATIAAFEAENSAAAAAEFESANNATNVGAGTMKENNNDEDEEEDDEELLLFGASASTRACVKPQESDSDCTQHEQQHEQRVASSSATSRPSTTTTTTQALSAKDSFFLNYYRQQEAERAEHMRREQQRQQQEREEEARSLAAAAAAAQSAEAAERTRRKRDEAQQQQQQQQQQQRQQQAQARQVSRSSVASCSSVSTSAVVTADATATTSPASWPALTVHIVNDGSVHLLDRPLLLPGVWRQRTVKEVANETLRHFCNIRHKTMTMIQKQQQQQQVHHHATLGADASANAGTSWALLEQGALFVIRRAWVFDESASAADEQERALVAEGDIVSHAIASTEGLVFQLVRGTDADMQRLSGAPLESNNSNGNNNNNNKSEAIERKLSLGTAASASVAKLQQQAHTPSSLVAAAPGAAVSQLDRDFYQQPSQHSQQHLPPTATATATAALLSAAGASPPQRTARVAPPRALPGASPVTLTNRATMENSNGGVGGAYNNQDSNLSCAAQSTGSVARTACSGGDDSLLFGCTPQQQQQQQRTVPTVEECFDALMKHFGVDPSQAGAMCFQVSRDGATPLVLMHQRRKE